MASSGDGSGGHHDGQEHEPLLASSDSKRDSSSVTLPVSSKPITIPPTKDGAKGSEAHMEEDSLSTRMVTVFLALFFYECVELSLYRIWYTKSCSWFCAHHNIRLTLSVYVAACRYGFNVFLAGIEGVTLTDYAWLLAIGDIAAILPVFFAGPLDRVRARTVFLLSGFLQCVITFAMAPVASFTMALCYRFLYGLCRALLSSSVAVLIGEQLPVRHHAVFTGNSLLFALFVHAYDSES
jgi:MFS family permease